MKQKFLIIGGIIILLLISLIYLYPQLAQPPKPTNFENLMITLERTACFGTCPIYKLTIKGDGTVIYEGERFVNVTGTQTTKISSDKIRELVDEFYKSGYFSLKESYTKKCDIRGCMHVTDLPTTITSITIDEKTKRVENYFGAPEKLDELQNKIDDITNSKMWIEGK